MNKKLCLLSAILVFSLFSCGRGGESALLSLEGSQDYLHNIDEMTLDKSENSSLIERKIVKDGTIRFKTSNAQETRARIIKGVSAAKGYISSDNVFDYKTTIEHSLTIRIPSDKFDSMVQDLSQSALKLEFKEINAKDVTEEFIDLEARIKTKKELENRFKELLRQARNVEEILTVEKEIGKLRTEIESIEGRFRYLNDRVSFSTLNVVFYEKTSHSFGFVKKIGEGLKNGWINLLWLAVGLIHIWPFLLVIAIGGVLYWKNLRKKRK